MKYTKSKFLLAAIGALSLYAVNVDGVTHQIVAHQIIDTAQSKGVVIDKDIKVYAIEDQVRMIEDSLINLSCHMDEKHANLAYNAANELVRKVELLGENEKPTFWWFELIFSNVMKKQKIPLDTQKYILQILSEKSESKHGWLAHKVLKVREFHPSFKSVVGEIYLHIYGMEFDKLFRALYTADDDDDTNTGASESDGTPPPLPSQPHPHLRAQGSNGSASPVASGTPLPRISSPVSVSPNSLSSTPPALPVAKTAQAVSRGALLPPLVILDGSALARELHRILFSNPNYRHMLEEANEGNNEDANWEV